MMAKWNTQAANIAAQRDEALNQLDSARHTIDVLEGRLSAFLANQHYQYIGADGKAVLARDLEDRLIAAEERLRAVEAENEALRDDYTDICFNIDCEREDKMNALYAAAEWQRRAETAEAELARIRAADRTSITVRTETAAKMRKGQAI